MQNKIDIDALKARFDLVRYASKLTKLERKPDGYWGRCVFHEERTASMKIFLDGAHYYCHGCGATGDSIAFVAHHEGLDETQDFVRVCEIMSGEDYRMSASEQKRRDTLQRESPHKPVTEQAMQSVQEGKNTYKLAKVYKYADDLIKCRYESENGKKSFRWFHSYKNSWCWGKGGITNGLYWAGNKSSERVFVAEGEKSVDALAECGLTATTASDGADPEASKWTDTYTEELRGRDVVVLNDDDRGKKVNLGVVYADAVAGKLQGIAKSVRRISPNDLRKNTDKISGYDIADVVQFLGTDGTRAKIEEVLAREPEPTSVTPIVELEKLSSDDAVNTFIYHAAEVMHKENLQQMSIRLEEEYNQLENKPGKRAMLQAIRQVLIERRRAAASDIVVDDGSASIMLGEQTWDIDGTGYRCDNGRIIDCATGEVVLPHLCVYAAEVIDVETEFHRDLLMFNKISEPYRVYTQTFAADELRMAQKVVSATAKWGIETDSLTATSFCSFIKAMKVKQGTNIRKIHEINRIGWYNGFLLPYEAETAGVTIRQGEVDSKIAAAFASQSGSAEASLELIQEVVSKVSIAPIVLGNITSSLFMEKIGRQGQTHVLNISGKSGWGKTKLIDVMFSLYGDSLSEKMYGGSDSTIQSAQNKAGYLRNFTLYLDDPLQATKENKNEAQQRIYNLVSGQGRQRNSRSGESRAYKEWFCNILYTNEAALYTDDDSVKGGVLNRILDVDIEEKISEQDIMRWVEVMRKNHGHFGQKFAGHIRLMEADDINKWINREYEKFAELAVDSKRGQTAAVIAVGYYFAQNLLGLVTPFPYDIVAKNVHKAGEISDGARAWIRFEAWLNGNVALFRNQVDIKGTLWGALTYNLDGKKVIAVQTAKLAEICSELVIPKAAMLQHCVVSGIVDKDETSHFISVRGNSKAKVCSFIYDWDEPAHYAAQSASDYEYMEG
jgi:hypothetical protein